MPFVFDSSAENREIGRRLAAVGQLPKTLENANLTRMIGTDSRGNPVLPNNLVAAMGLSDSARVAAGLLNDRASSLARVAALDLDIASPAEEASKMFSGSIMTGMADAINREMTEFSVGIRALEESQCLGRKMLDALSPAAELRKLASGITDIVPRETAKVGAGLLALDESRFAGKKMLDEFSGMSALSQLATGLFDHSPFDDACAIAMRQALGDWRDIAEFPEPLLDNPLARMDFYHDLGFDRALTDRPTSAYMVTLDAIDLPISQPSEPALYRRYLPEPDEFADGRDHISAVPRLNRKAYRKLYIMETSLRSFIDPLMCATYGRAWLRERMPDLYTQLCDKRERDIAAGRDPSPLMDYADFTDYHDIIIRRTHWNDIFRAYFYRKQDISESLIRLYPARHCTMHGRIITREDYLLVVVEVNRILRAIKRSRH